MDLDEDGTIESYIAWTHPGAAGTIEAALREELLAELADVQPAVLVGRGEMTSGMDRASAEQALLLALMCRVEEAS